jgi:hypothetical protein
MMKMPVSINDAGFVCGFGLFGWGLWGWHWQIAAVVVGGLIMALSAWGALGERMDARNTRKDA